MQLGTRSHSPRPQAESASSWRRHGASAACGICPSTHIDFDMAQITVRDGKGEKDRVTLLPQSLAPSLREQLAKARELYDEDVARGRANVYLPYALAEKYPQAPRQWA